MSTAVPESREIPSVATQLTVNAARYATDPALSWTQAGMSTTITWSVLRDRVVAAGAALTAMGLNSRGLIVVMAPLGPEAIIAELAAMRCGSTVANVPPTLSDEGLGLILAECQPAVVLVEDDEQAERVLRLIPAPELVPAVVTTRSSACYTDWTMLESRAVRPAEWQLAEMPDGTVITYTQGTTGSPRPVRLTARHILCAVESLVTSGLFDFDYRTITDLPSAHISARIWSVYLPLRLAGHVVCCPNPQELIPQAIKYRPTFVVGTPRTFADIRDIAHRHIDRTVDDCDALEAERRTLVNVWDLRRAGSHVVDALDLDAEIARSGLTRSLRFDLGLDRVRLAMTSHGSIADDLRQFFASIGMDVLSTYGAAETCGLGLIERRAHAPYGSVGTPLPGWEARVTHDGELQVRGPWTANEPTEGPLSTRVQSHDWWNSGDCARCDDLGRISVYGRLQDAMEMTDGTRIHPAPVEALLSGRGLIDHALVFRVERDSLAVLVTLHPARLSRFARRTGLSGVEPERLVFHAQVREEVCRAIGDAARGAGFPHPISRFQVVAGAWTVENGAVTAAGQLRRRELMTRHARVIDELCSTTHNEGNDHDD